MPLQPSKRGTPIDLRHEVSPKPIGAQARLPRRLECFRTIGVQLTGPVERKRFRHLEALPVLIRYVEVGSDLLQRLGEDGLHLPKSLFPHPIVLNGHPLVQHPCDVGFHLVRMVCDHLGYHQPLCEDFEVEIIHLPRNPIPPANPRSKHSKGSLGGFLDIVCWYVHRVTVAGNEIQCDAFACDVTALPTIRFDFQPNDLRFRYAMLGWRTGGDEGELDFCPLHVAP